MNYRWLRSLLGIVCSSLVLGITTTPAIADEPAPASQAARVKAADDAFQEGRALLKKGKLAEACAKLEQSQTLDPATGTLLNLADCYERIGKTASAWRAFHHAAVQAGRAGRTDREKEARERVEKLEPRLSRLEIQIAAPEKKLGLEIKRDGAAVSKVQWDKAVPVDPGPHMLSATAPGMPPWKDTIDVTGTGTTVVVVVPDYVPPKPPSSLAHPPTKRYNTAMRNGGIILMVIGQIVFIPSSIVALAVGGDASPGLEDSPERVRPIISSVAGATILSIGIALTTVGSQQMPTTTPPAATQAFRPTLTLGPTFAHVRMAF